MQFELNLKQTALLCLKEHNKAISLNELAILINVENRNLVCKQDLANIVWQLERAGKVSVEKNLKIKINE